MGPPPDAPDDPALRLEAHEYTDLLDYIVGKANMVQVQLRGGRVLRQTPLQHAVLRYQDAFRSARTVPEQDTLCRALAQALGARRAEAGTTLALRAVLMQLNHGWSDDEALRMVPCAARATFHKWRTRVHKARLNMDEGARILRSDRRLCQAYRLV